MGPSARQARKQITELLHGRPGWRLEASTTPGAAPLWCFVVDGVIEFSVTLEDGAIRLYVMDTDDEIAFADSHALTAWLTEHRADALADPPARPDAKTRTQSPFRWS